MRKVCISILCVMLVQCHSFVCLAQQDTILIDFGSPNITSPFPWNNLLDYSSGQIGNLLNSKGYATGISIAVYDAFTGANTNGTQNPTAALGIPVTATRDNFFGNTQVFGGSIQPTGGLRFSGLDLAKSYTLNIFASRIASDNRETQYVVNGQGSDTLLLNVSSNTSSLATTTLFPDSSACIEIQASAGPNNNNPYGFYHLSALKLLYAHEPLGPPSLELVSPNGGEIWQAGKSPKIFWRSKNINIILIEYSIDNGSTWMLIDSTPAYTGEYAWVVPNTPSSQTWVRIKKSNQIAMSQNSFSIVSDSMVCPIVVLGSSTAAGAGPGVLDSAWVSRYRAFLFQKNTRIEVISLAKGGYTTYHILPTGSILPPGISIPIDTARNITKALSFNPFAVIINLPSNDASYLFSVQEQLVNYDILATQLNTLGIDFGICSPQPRNFSNPQQLQIQHAMFDSIIQIYGVNAIDFWTDLADSIGFINPIYNSGDGIHLNDAGHRILFERVRNKNLDSLACSIPVGQQQALQKSFSSVNVYPCPFYDHLKIDCVTRSTGSVHFKLFDVFGRLVDSHEETVSTPGKHTFDWSPILDPTRHFQVFLLQVRLLDNQIESYAVFKLLKYGR